MLLSEDVLSRVDYYTCNRFTEGGKMSSVTLYWKTTWWQFWLERKQVISMSTVQSTGASMRCADNEWIELVEQLKHWFNNLTPKTHTAKLIIFKGGKNE